MFIGDRMKGIKNIVYKINNQALIINIGEKNQIEYKDILGTVSQEKIFEYLENFFGIIDNWDKEYINTSMIDGINWDLSIIYYDGNKKEYRGRAKYPNNFEAFERLNQKLINKVQNGQFNY